MSNGMHLTSRAINKIMQQLGLFYLDNYKDTKGSTVFDNVVCKIMSFYDYNLPRYTPWQVWTEDWLESDWDGDSTRPKMANTSLRNPVNHTIPETKMSKAAQVNKMLTDARRLREEQAAGETVSDKESSGSESDDIDMSVSDEPAPRHASPSVSRKSVTPMPPTPRSRSKSLLRQSPAPAKVTQSSTRTRKNEAGKEKMDESRAPNAVEVGEDGKVAIDSALLKSLLEAVSGQGTKATTSTRRQRPSIQPKEVSDSSGEDISDYDNTVNEIIKKLAPKTTKSPKRSRTPRAVGRHLLDSSDDD